ncbi:methyl-accepting chemotaxis protein [Sporomusa malonica]|uniref:Methyl-accepting chemotaxis protein (MCP) signalling domain-containing protein n=1 Tax=Sporomusa malonica TaxID=112901 RepID=A0A1W2A8E2_9FIRM|nr:methyl-accepting chemotaxis protein [Sporomusa malonica]SMC56701.1 Methyl-accepting chemotaxis protein (MCP) signalling domain-containing protein [Sporomusa malonica]
MTELDCAIRSATVYQHLVPIDCCVMICNTEGVVVKFLPAKTFDMRVKEGDTIPTNGTLGDCLKTHKEVFKTLPKELYGVAIKAIAYPVFENGVLVGASAMGFSLSSQQTLMESAQNIAATSQEITATTEELAASATSLAQQLDDLKSRGERVIQELKKTDDILKFVSDVSTNSNLLGLNAAIEAARAGEHGRGFAVVATEIRKMADNSSQAVKDIKAVLQAIQRDTTGIITGIGETAIIGERQAAASQEISASMQQLASSATDIEKVAEII